MSLIIFKSLDIVNLTHGSHSIAQDKHRKMKKNLSIHWPPFRARYLYQGDDSHGFVTTFDMCSFHKIMVFEKCHK